MYGTQHIRHDQGSHHDQDSPPPPPPPTLQWLKRLAFPALIALVAGLGTAHILVRTSTYGAVISNDTFRYFDAAERLVEGIDLGHLATFPPFFSMTMAFLSLFGVAPVDGGRFLNAAAFGLLILASGLWLSRRLYSRWVALGAAVAVMVALPLAHSASTIRSEPLFILFTILAMMPLESFLNRRSGKRALVLSAILAALAVLTRYMGVTLIFSAVLMLLLRRDTPVRERLQESLAFGAISSLPLAVVLTRNYLATGTLTGNRSAALGQPLSDSLIQIVAVFKEWADLLALFPGQLQHWPVLAVGLLLLLLAALLVTGPRLRRESAVFWFFALAYLAIIIAAVPLTTGGIDSRFLTPVYVPLLFVAAFWLDGLLRRRTSARLAVVRWTLVALALLAGAVHIGISAQQNLRLTATALDSGYIGKSYNTAYWQDSKLVEYLRSTPIAGRYYSNNPHVLRWNAGVPATLVSGVPVPRRKLHDIGNCQDWFEQAVLRAQRHGKPDARIVWVAHRINCTLLQMESSLPLEPVAELADGAVFRLNPAFDSAAARQSAYEALVSGKPVLALSDFDLYLSENTLVYVKDPCVPADTEPPFFLHLFPVAVDDLPVDRRRHGFDNLDFNFAGKCMSAMTLPEYDIARIRTGQYVPAADGFNNLWEVELPFTPNKEETPQ